MQLDKEKHSDIPSSPVTWPEEKAYDVHSQSLQSVQVFASCQHDFSNQLRLEEQPWATPSSVIEMGGHNSNKLKSVIIPKSRHETPTISLT